MLVVAQFKSSVFGRFFRQTLKRQTIVIVRWNLIINLRAHFFFACLHLVTRVCFLSRINNEKQSAILKFWKFPNEQTAISRQIVC